MRIYIIGLPGSGKSTLAKLLARKFNLPHIDLDSIFIKYDNNMRTRYYIEDCNHEIDTLATNPSWVIEGVYPIKRHIDSADYIVWLQIPAITCIFRQWKRYASDPHQREVHGLINNIKLSILIIGSSYNLTGIKVSKLKPRIKLKQLKVLLAPYKDKVNVINSSRQLNIWLKSFN